MRQFYEEVVQHGNFARLHELVAANFADHNPGPGQAPGAEGIKQFFAAMRGAVSDLRVSVEDIIAEGDKIAAHVSVSGKHTGELMGIPTQREGRCDAGLRYCADRKRKSCGAVGHRGYVWLRVSGIAVLTCTRR